MKHDKPVASILRACADLYDLKSATYSPNDDDLYENFRFAAAYRNARRPGAPPMDALDSCYFLIGLKESRMRTLARIQAQGNDTAFESMKDTQQDRIVYEAIAVVIADLVAKGAL